ncbi:hypothetical protein [Lactobacillus apis]|uniref:hypothetical protein n=1 Tax=Lactobacillus apis TaxID=303541 RepID=UPI001650CEC4|nr:hypothetical protein [Lactobacillus apis]MBC6360589.1 hypothetical protein [Lactobacillus apis]
MHDLNSWVQVLAGAIGTIATALAVAHKTNRADYDAIIKEHRAEKEELKKERDEFKKSYYEERELRNKAENELLECKTKYKILSEKLKQQKSTRNKS